MISVLELASKYPNLFESITGQCTCINLILELTKQPYSEQLIAELEHQRHLLEKYSEYATVEYSDRMQTVINILLDMPQSKI